MDELINNLMNTPENTNPNVLRGQLQKLAGSGGSSITVDDALSATSTNPVQNKVVKAALDDKQNTLIAGENVTISDDTISVDLDSSTIAASVTDWLDENVDPVGSAVVVDSSLSIEGAVADAKATGDAIAAASAHSGLTEEVKQALLDCFENVAWINDDGQTYYDALYAALYNEPAPPSPVPSEYQRVEWVGTQNSSIAYILTGISESGMAALAGYSIHLTAAFGVSQPFDGIDTNGSVIAFSSKAGTYFGSLKTGRVAIGTSETYALPSSVVCTNKNDYIAEYSNTGLTISSNNQSVSRNYSTSGDTAQELTIGTGSISSYNVAAWSQFYSVRVYKNETLVADFFPVYRIADGVIGFYDAVRNQFYTNSGSGSFVKGGDIA